MPDDDPVFRAAVESVLEHEGGYSMDPRDPGGETNWGISKRAYPHIDIVNLTRDEAITIYRRDYWDKLLLSRLPPGVALVTMDAAVNCGPGQAIRWLQRVVDVTQDGVIGPVTIAAVRGTARKSGGRELVARLLSERLLYLAGLPHWPTYRNGWTSRVIRLAIASASM